MSSFLFQTEPLLDLIASSDMSMEIPITYITHYIASKLLPEGPTMFQRESDTDCILCVGQQRYYVHMPMLAVRSPTFRRIFDAMIADGVWESDNLDKESSFTPPSLPEGAGTPGTIEQDVNVEDSNSFLPELTLSLVDPEGSRFDELLYWIYTNNGARWQKNFTAQNYNSILQNNELLNMFDPQILLICEAFEKTTDPKLGLIGLAEQLFCLQ